ncbi:MAG TPA: hypothetical protein VLA16_02870 [Ideonella sp.]|nr:hypothetical protein [Ideonella sp.]
MKLTRSLAVAGLLINTLVAHAGNAVVTAPGCRTNLKTGRYHCNQAPAVALKTPLGNSGRLLLKTRVPAPRATSAAVPLAAGSQTCFVGRRGNTYKITADGRKQHGSC